MFNRIYPYTLIVSVCCLWAWFCYSLGSIQVHAQTPPPPPTPIPWFTVTVGKSRCSASKIPQSPIRIQYGCINPYGTNYGAYTADPVNGIYGTTWFEISANSQNMFAPQSDPTLPPVVIPEVDTVLRCTVVVNSTNFTVTVINAQSLPPLSASYSCPSQSITTGNTIISWP